MENGKWKIENGKMNGMKRIFTAICILLAMSVQAVTVNDAAGTFKGTLKVGNQTYSNKEVYVLPGTTNNAVTIVLPGVAFSSKNADLVLVDMTLNSNGKLAIGHADTYVQQISSSSVSASSMSFNFKITTPSLQQVTTVTFSGSKVSDQNYAITNGGFEGSWSNNEAQGWHSFYTATGSLAGTARNSTQFTQATDVRPGSAGSHSALIQSKYIVGAKANGNCTNGQIYAGSMTAADATGNYNFSDPDSAFNTPFHGRPDSIVFWAKYIPGDRNASNAANQARLNAVITTDARYQDPEDDPAKYNDVRLAAGFVNYSATPDLGWQRIAVPFIYDPANLDKEPAYILTTFTTNMVPGGGTGTKDQPDKVYLDDAELVYNNHLLSLTRGDEAITFDGVSYKINETYCDSCGIFEGVEDGVSAQSFFAYDALHKCVFVYVIADDYAQSGKYTVYRIDYTDTNADGTSLDPKVPEEQGIEEIITHEARFEKVLINGQLFIRSNDAWYNASGVRVK